MQLTDQWLAHLQKSVVRLETGCTASFVSAEGLVLTNHHCVAECLADNSSAQRDLIANGYIAARLEDELRCQGAQASVLMSTENITDRVTKSHRRRRTSGGHRRSQQGADDARSQLRGGVQAGGYAARLRIRHLVSGRPVLALQYKRYDDVRLAFAPEQAIGAFGGDPDNFQFPRWCLDMSLLRVYENGKPASTPDHLSFEWAGAKEGEPVFVAGHPGTTQRLLTVAQLKTQRDVLLPFWLLRFPSCADE